MVTFPHRPRDRSRQQLQESLAHLTDLLEAVTDGGPSPTSQGSVISPEQLADLWGMQQTLQDAITCIDDQPSSQREAAARRWRFPRRLLRAPIRRRRFRVRADVLSAEEVRLGDELMRHQARIRADLERQAVEVVGTTLDRMRAREQETARRNPELRPYLTAFFEQSRQTLLRATGDVLVPTYPGDPIDIARQSPGRGRDAVSDPDVPTEDEHGPA